MEFVRAVRGIPASVGSSSAPARWARGSWDHPRGCVEHIGNINIRAGGQGLPPRMRGAEGVHTGLGPIPRVRGAEHGLSGGDARARKPRGCGEQEAPAPWLGYGEGPTSRVGRERTAALHGGTNPAGAGSRTPWTPWSISTWDQPRGCGEQRRPDSTMTRGSEPTLRACGAGFRVLDPASHAGPTLRARDFRSSAEVAVRGAGGAVGV